MRIVIIGAGDGGLVVSVRLAGLGHDVVCVDRDAERIAAVESGDRSIEKHGFARAIASERAAGRLRFATSGAAALNAAQVVFISEAAPAAGLDRGPDSVGIFRAAREIAAVARHGLVVVFDAMALAETAHALRSIISGIRPNLDFAVVANPVRLREGRELRDFMAADRIIVGSDEAWARALIASLYEPMLQAGARLIVTGLRDAEAIASSPSTPPRAVRARSTDAAARRRRPRSTEVPALRAEDHRDALVPG